MNTASAFNLTPNGGHIRF